MPHLGAMVGFVVVLMVAGCAPTVPGVWTKPAAEPREQRRDEYECAREAAFAADAGAERRAAFAACMRARGYELVQNR